MKKLILIISAFLCLAGAPAIAHADFNTLQGACTNSTAAAQSPICKQNQAQLNDPNNTNPVAGTTGILQTVTNVMALLTGIVAVAMIISSGITFITAGGNLAGQRSGDNPSKAKKARAQLTAAVIGLLIVALSWSILSFIIEKFVK